MLRHADPARDASACAAIYAPYVRNSAVSFEEEAPDERAMEERISSLTATYPWLIAEIDETVAGFSYAAPHRSRPAYRWAADVTVYVDSAFQRRGLGRMLYAALFALLSRQRLTSACAGITLPNDASVGLHESMGFVLVGVYRRIGFKDGAWRDVGWWQLELTGRGDSGDPPEEPLGPQTLDSL